MYCRQCGAIMHEQQSICLKCGVEAGKGNNFCYCCGNAVVPEAVICVKCGVPLNNRVNTSGGSTAGIKPRSIVVAVILSLVTCGIYGFYWFIALTNEMNKASGKTTDTSGGVALLLSLVTCGFYQIYWGYTLGKKRDIVANENDSSPILYLVLCIFIPIVVYCLAQDTLNNAIKRDGTTI